MSRPPVFRPPVRIIAPVALSWTRIWTACSSIQASGLAHCLVVSVNDAVVAAHLSRAARPTSAQTK